MADDCTDLGQEKSRSLEGTFFSGPSKSAGARLTVFGTGLSDKQVEEAVTGLVKTEGA